VAASLALSGVEQIGASGPAVGIGFQPVISNAVQVKSILRLFAPQPAPMMRHREPSSPMRRSQDHLRYEHPAPPFQHEPPVSSYHFFQLGLPFRGFQVG